MNKSIFEFIHPEYLDLVKQRVKERRSDPLELKLIKKDGSEFYAETLGKEGIYKDENVRVISINNITKRKESEKEILKLSATVEQSPLSIVITDLAGTLEYVNPRFLETTGYTKEEAIGANPRILSTGHTSKEEYKELWDTILSGNVWIGEFLNRRKDGTMYWEEATIAPVKNKLGEIVSFVGLKVNITEKKQAEKKLMQSQKELEETVKARNKLFSIISHDLRSPFNAILGFSEIMVNKSKDGDFEGFEELSNYVLKAATQSFELLDNLLHWSRIQTGRMKYSPEKVNLKELTEKIFDLLKAGADEKHINLSIESQENLDIKADKFMFETVIRNLISNAIKFTPEKGIVKVNFEILGDEIVYKVSDTGIGIEKENIEKLFMVDSSFTTEGTKQEKGTGLGLILCKEFVDMHKGNITVDSEVGTGSTFSVFLPA
jgi:PAS domain S-box-containing protein